MCKVKELHQMRMALMERGRREEGDEWKKQRV